MVDKLDLLDGGFESQCERMRRLVEGGCVTPELGSLLLSYYAMGREEAAREVCDAASYAKEHFNPEHDASMNAYRSARPAKLVVA